MESERLIYLIDQREAGVLSPEEAQELTQLMTTEEAVSLATLHLSLRKELVAEGRSQLSEKLHNWEEEISNNEGSKPTRGRVISFPRWGGMLAIAAVIAVFLLVILPDQQTPGSRLFEELSAPYPNVLYPLERGETSLTDFEELFAEYEAGNFEGFLAKLNQIDTTAASFDFYQSIALRQLERFSEAEALLASVSEEDTEFSDQADWYLAMTYWDLGKEAAADQMIRRIAEQPDHEMYKRAIKWLEALD